MNRIYKILKIVFKNISTYFCVFYLTFQPVFAQTVANNALPANPNVTSGSATFNQTTNQLTINQATDKLITNWSSFNIGKDATVTFNQPSSLSSALNRVNSNDPSYIFGKLNANGQVILLNQSGVIFGNGAKFDAGSFIASTLNIKDTDFLNGRMVFEKDGVAGSITNEGYLNAFAGGAVALIAPQIINNGTISAETGTAALLTGNKVTLSLNGNKLIKYTIDEGTLNSYIENNGAIKVDEGVIILSAKTLDDLSKSVISNSGLIEAKGISTKGGKIILEGDDITLKSTSVVDASGNLGGGEVLIGGDYQGKNPDIRNAKTITAKEGSITKADAITEGDGGKIIFWSDELTNFYGNIFARGGSVSGDGGFVEVSSKGKLNYTGVTNTLAMYGKVGTLLLDPSYYYIGSSSPTVTDTDHSYLSITDLNTAISNSSVTLAAAGIYFGSNLTWDGGGTTKTLTLDAPTTTLAANITASNGALNIDIGNGSASKNLYVLGGNRTINSNNGTITLSGNIGSDGSSGLTLNSGTGATSIKNSTGLTSGTYWAGVGSQVNAGLEILKYKPGNGATVTVDLVAGSITSSAGDVTDVTSPLPGSFSVSNGTTLDLNADPGSPVYYKTISNGVVSAEQSLTAGTGPNAGKIIFVTGGSIVYLRYVSGTASTVSITSSSTSKSFTSPNVGTGTLSSLLVSGTGAITLNGNVTTSGNQTYTGATTLSGGDH
jgi:filamentous hemagglutinin family protein